MKGHLLSPPHNYPALKQESAIDWPSPGLGGRLKGQWEGLNLRPGLEDIEIESVFGCEQENEFYSTRTWEWRRSEMLAGVSAGEFKLLLLNLFYIFPSWPSSANTPHTDQNTSVSPSIHFQSFLSILCVRNRNSTALIYIYIYIYIILVFLHGNHSFHKNIMATRVISDVCQDA